MKHIIILREMLRTFRKNLSTGILSLLGLSIGLTVALLIGLWSLNEFSFDNFHKDPQEVYRICRKGFLNGETTLIGADFGPVGLEVKNELSEVKEVCRIRPFNRELVKIKGITAYENQIITSDKNLFQFFSFKLEQGNPETCLDGPGKIVIDRYLADKYYKDEKALGQMFEIFGQQFQISAIMEPVPGNSHLKFRIIIPFEGLSWINDKSWGNNDSYITYLRISKREDLEALSRKISEITYKHFPVYKQYQITHFLQPLSEIHFSAGFRFDPVLSNDRRMIFIFITIAVLILAIACFNFINLFISTSFQRAKAIGIKKINGISGAGLFFYSLLETGLYILIGIILAFVIAYLALPFFNQLTGGNLFFDFGNHTLYLFTAGLMIFTLMTAGIFPVMYILRFNPQEIIKSRFNGSGITVLQRILVVSQFAASIILIASTLIIKKQLNFIRNKDLGFDTSQVIWLQMRNLAGNYESVREELLRNPAVTDVTAKTCLPNDWNNGNPIVTDENPDAQILAEMCEVTHNYTQMMNIPLVEGSNPFKPGENRRDVCLINEKTAEALEIDDPVGSQIQLVDNRKVTISGVLKNVNTKSLHIGIDPQVYLQMGNTEPWHYMLVKSSVHTERVIHSLQTLWQKYNPDIPFEYNFLDDTYNQLYHNETIASRTVTVGMGIALMLAFMGLFAMAHYATEKRVKEIGIRKVNGAKIYEILILLNRDFIKWVVVSFLIASPISIYAMHQWLSNFAYQTELSWWVFALSGSLALGVALLTVSWQSWRAATRNPVEALRYE